jgi:hypothetical protein
MLEKGATLAAFSQSDFVRYELLVKEEEQGIRVFDKIHAAPVASQFANLSLDLSCRLLISRMGSRLNFGPP